MLWSASGRGRDFYVSPSGEDGNPATELEPWRTIDRVNSGSFAAGDRILAQYRITADRSPDLQDEAVEASP